MTAAAIASYGMLTPLGRTGLQTSLMLRAARVAAAPLPARLGSSRRSSCRVQDLPDDCMGQARLLALAAPALAEAAAPLAVPSADLDADASPDPVADPTQSPFRDVPLLLAVPKEAGGGAEWLARLSKRSGVGFDVNASECIAGGRLAGLPALERALAVLRDGAAAVLVGAVDSHHDAERLAAYWASTGSTNVLAPRTHGRALPGEAAAFLLLTNRNAAAEIQAPTLAHLAAPLSKAVDSALQEALVERVHERSAIRQRPGYKRLCSVEPPCDEALQELLGEALQPAAKQQSCWILSDGGRDPVAMEQWSMSTRGQIDSTWKHSQPGMQLGDAGAATLPLLLALAVAGWQLSFAPAEHALVVSQGDPLARVAIPLWNVEPSLEHRS